MMIKGQVIRILLIVSFALALPVAAGTADLVPDPGFDGDGMAITKIGAGKDEAQAIGVQDDGSIVVAGRSGIPDASDMAVLRYLPDGSIDRTFHFSAGPMIGTGLGSDGVRALALDAEGRIVLGGYVTENGARYGALVRLLDDGGLDYRFGDGGVVLYRSADDETEFFDIVIHADQKILAAGATGEDPDRMPLFARFNDDGSPDDTFGADGEQRIPDLNGALHGLAEDSTGSTIAGGYALDDNERAQLLLIRITNDGTLDETFAVDGLSVVSETDAGIVVHDVGLLADGRVVAVGEIVPETGLSAVMISRFLEDGSADTNLSQSGILSYGIGEESGVYGVSVLDSGVILAAGYRRDGNGKDTIVLRLDSSGSAITEIEPREADDETAESDTGRAQILSISALQVEDGSYTTPLDADLITTELAESDEQSLAVEAQDDGTVYTAGSSGSGDDTALMVTRYASEEVEAAALSEQPDLQPGDYYTIKTLPVSDITRVGAMTGGQITAKDFDSEECIAACEASCGADDAMDESSEEEESPDSEDSGTETDLTCIEECTEGCTAPTVVQRGVVFSIDPDPEYNEDAAADPGDAEDSEDEDDSTGSITDLEDPDDESANPFSSGGLLNLDDYVVEGGQTDDGDGDGQYTSEIEDVNPQTVYYVRAYALLSDGSVMYGEQTNFRTEDSCFIATAAFGSIDGSGVQVLRQFRDTFLQTNRPGSIVVGWYYKLSPQIADVVGQSVMLRLLVIVLLLPVIVWAWMMLHTGVIVPGIGAVALVGLYVKIKDELETI